MDVNKLLDELEEYVEHSKVPVMGKARWFRKAFLLDVDDLLDFTHQVRESLPQQIQRADQITREKDRILNEAREQAERMVTEAAAQAELTIRKSQEEARMLVAGHEITRQAQQEGQRIIEQVKQEGEAIRRGALEYARNVMDNLNQSVNNLSQHVSQVQVVAQRARDEINV